MKTKRYYLSILVITVLSFSLIACNMSGGNGNTGGNTSSSKSLPDKLQYADISILVNIPSPDDPPPIHRMATEMFTQKYGGKVTFIPSMWNELQQKLITLLVAGDAPDVTFFNQTMMPGYAIENLVQPIEEYFDLNDSMWNMDIMNQFKWGGKHYAISYDANAQMIYFNKTMFENNGIKTPLEYYKEGNWNWGTFREVARALTQDTTRDGNIDQWGFGSHQERNFLATNDTDFIEYQQDGSIKIIVNDPKTIEALRFIQEGLTEGWMKKRTNLHQTEFPQGKLGMTIAKKFVAGENNFLADMKDEWDIAPFPVGPSGTLNVTSGASPFWGIPTGAKNPQGGAAWIYMIVTVAEQERDNLVRENHTPQQIELIKMLEKNILVPKYQGLGNLNNMTNSFVNSLSRGTPVTTAVDSFIPELQAEIDRAIKR